MGGQGAPHIRLMDNVAKTFQCHVSLGSTFWQTITTVVFHDRTNMHCLTRIALCMVNLTTNMKEDGVAKCITKQDILKLAGKSQAAKAHDAEETL